MDATVQPTEDDLLTRQRSKVLLHQELELAELADCAVAPDADDLLARQRSSVHVDAEASTPINMTAVDQQDVETIWQASPTRDAPATTPMMPEDELRAKLRPIFDTFDLESAGTVSTESIAQIFEAMGIATSPKQLGQLKQDNTSNEFDFDGLVAMLENHKQEQIDTGEGASAQASVLFATVAATASTAYEKLKTVDLMDPSTWWWFPAKTATPSKATEGTAPERESDNQAAEQFALAEAVCAAEAIAEPSDEAPILVFTPFWEARKAKNQLNRKPIFRTVPAPKRRVRQQSAHTESNSRPLPAEIKRQRERGWNNRPYYNVPATLKGLRTRTEEPWTPDADEYLKAASTTTIAQRRKNPYNLSSAEEYLEVSKLRSDRAPQGKPAWDFTPARIVPSQLRGMRVQTKEPWAIDAERERTLFADAHQLERDRREAALQRRKMRTTEVDDAVYEANLLACRWAKALAEDKWASALAA
mmetsp:Transcript_19546/g.49879  ORF Transcript_19546/g.49879 Transcript_19546/m.49879 type:complete len:475 (+) Transcript_19546:1-1425(+)